MRSRAATLRAGEEMTSPFTATRPAAIQASASRRDARPAPAITLAMRSPSGAAGFSLLRAMIGSRIRESVVRSNRVQKPSFMDLAIEEARAAQAAGEVPIGCVIVCDGGIVARAGNRTLRDRDPTAHAEMLALRQAGAAIHSERLVDCDLYVTLEPCAMCAGALSLARVRRLYYGAADPKGGAVDSGVRFFSSPSCHHRPEVYGGIGEAPAPAPVRHFFAPPRYPDTPPTPSHALSLPLT